MNREKVPRLAGYKKIAAMNVRVACMVAGLTPLLTGGGELGVINVSNLTSKISQKLNCCKKENPKVLMSLHSTAGRDAISPEDKKKLSLLIDACCCGCC